MDEVFEENSKSKNKEEKLRKKYEKKAAQILKKEEKKSAKLSKKDSKKNESKKPISKMKILKIVIATFAIVAMLFSVCATLLLCLFQ